MYYNAFVLRNDKTTKAFYNASAYTKAENKGIKSFLEYLRSNRTNSGLSQKIEQAVDKARKLERWRMEYMTWNLAITDAEKRAAKEGMARGLEEGNQKKALEHTPSASTSKLITAIAACEIFGSKDKLKVGNELKMVAWDASRAGFAKGEKMSLKQALSGLFSPLAAASFLVFTLLYTPCVAAISAVKREMGSGWHALAVAAFQTTVAWCMAFLLFQLGSMMIH